MTATAAPYGFIPTSHPSGNLRAKPYTIGTGYATALYKYAPVVLNTDGTLNAATTGSIIGIFAGVEYIDANGKPTKSNFWPASTTATSIVAWVWDDPATEFSVQSSGSIAAAAIGDQADSVNPSTGSTGTGLSQSSLNSTLAGNGSQKQFRIIDFDRDVANAAGDTYTKVIVKIAQHQYVADKTAI